LAPQAQPKAEPRAVWKLDLGLQSYSLRSFKFDDVLAKTQQLGLHFIEFFPRHLPQNLKPKELDAAKAKMAAHEVRVNAYGVCGMGRNEAANRRLFEFAKKAGFGVITANPSHDSLDLLDKLVEQYDVKIAIHNHGPGARWAKTDQMLKAVKGHHSHVGVCLDTGHLARAGDDPVEAVRKLGPRLHAFHFKDVNERNHDVVVGQGRIDLLAFFTALKEIRFGGVFSLEYEMNPRNPMPGIRQSLAAIREAVAKVG